MTTTTKRKFGKKNKIKVNPLEYNIGLIGESGIGKEQPLDALIAVEDGWKTMGEIEVGDKVYGEDGKLHNVVGTFPQGIKDIYKLTFSDGTSTESGLEHLWHVQTKKQREASRKHDDYRYQVKTLKEIMTDYDLPKCGYKYSIPLTKPVDYKNKETSVDPYILGLLLGDGGFTTPNITFTNSEEDLINQVSDYVVSKGFGVTHREFDAHAQLLFTQNEEGESFKKLLKELNGLGSREKFIPNEYLYNDIESRLNLLAGLINTDGHVVKGVSLIISTYSKQLSEDIATLALSLGLAAHSHNYDRTDEDSTKKYDEEVEYKVTICGDLSIIKDKLSNKHKANLKDREKQYVKSIVNIEYVGKKEAKCIKVDNPSHLYLTDNYIVTHNTSTLIQVAEKLVGEDGYMLLSLGKEDAVDAIAGAVYEEVPDWETFIEIADDIIENKQTDYKDLKVLIYDTIDQLFTIAEPYVIALSNKDAKPDKRAKTINQAFGGLTYLVHA